MEAKAAIKGFICILMLAATVAACTTEYSAVPDTIGPWDTYSNFGSTPTCIATPGIGIECCGDGSYALGGRGLMAVADDANQIWAASGYFNVTIQVEFPFRDADFDEMGFAGLALHNETWLKVNGTTDSGNSNPHYIQLAMETRAPNLLRLRCSGDQQGLGSVAGQNNTLNFFHPAGGENVSVSFGHNGSLIGNCPYKGAGYSYLPFINLRTYTASPDPACMELYHVELESNLTYNPAFEIYDEFGNVVHTQATCTTEVSAVTGDVNETSITRTNEQPVFAGTPQCSTSRSDNTDPFAASYVIGGGVYGDCTDNVGATFSGWSYFIMDVFDTVANMTVISDSSTVCNKIFELKRAVPAGFENVTNAVVKAHRVTDGTVVTAFNNGSLYYFEDVPCGTYDIEIVKAPYYSGFYAWDRWFDSQVETIILTSEQVKEVVRLDHTLTNTAVRPLYEFWGNIFTCTDFNGCQFTDPDNFPNVLPGCTYYGAYRFTDATMEYPAILSDYSYVCSVVQWKTYNADHNWLEYAVVNGSGSYQVSSDVGLDVFTKEICVRAVDDVSLDYVANVNVTMQFTGVPDIIAQGDANGKACVNYTFPYGTTPESLDFEALFRDNFGYFDTHVVGTAESKYSWLTAWALEPVNKAAYNAYGYALLEPQLTGIAGVRISTDCGIIGNLTNDSGFFIIAGIPSGTECGFTIDDIQYDPGIVSRTCNSDLTFNITAIRQSSNYTDVSLFVYTLNIFNEERGIDDVSISIKPSGSVGGVPMTYDTKDGQVVFHSLRVGASYELTFTKDGYNTKSISRVVDGRSFEKVRLYTEQLPSCTLAGSINLREGNASTPAPNSRVVVRFDGSIVDSRDTPNGMFSIDVVCGRDYEVTGFYENTEVTETCAPPSENNPTSSTCILTIDSSSNTFQNDLDLFSDFLKSLMIFGYLLALGIIGLVFVLLWRELMGE